MKKKLASLLYGSFLFTSVIFTSCTKTCDEGYEKKHCTTEIREKFLHDGYLTFVSTDRDSCENNIITADFTDTSSVIPGLNVNEIKLTNIRIKNNHVILVGKLNADNRISINPQIVSSHTFSGSGTYENGNLSVSYSAVKGCDTTRCISTYTR